MKQANDFFKNNIPTIITLNFIDALFFLSVFIIQFFTIPKILEISNKLFEILQNAYNLSDPAQLLDLDPAALQAGEFLSQYKILLTYTGINLLGILFLFLIFQGLIYFLLHKKIHSIELNFNWLLIPSIYYLLTLLLIFLTAQYTYTDFNLTLAVLTLLITLFIYSTSVFYSSLFLKKSFKELLVLPFTSFVLIKHFLLFLGVALIILYINNWFFAIHEILGLGFSLVFLFTFFQYSRIYAVFLVKNHSKIL